MSVFTDPRAERILYAEVEPYDMVAEAVVTKYLASEYYTTKPAETPANTQYAGVIRDDINFRREMFSGLQVAGRTVPDYGKLTILNTLEPGRAESRYDDWLDPLKFAFKGRVVRVYLQDKAQTFADRVQILEGVIDSLTYTENTITFNIRNKLYYFDRLLQQNRYGGLGGGNLYQYSEQLGNAWWTKTRATISADATTAPDGNVTADKLIEDNSNNTHFLQSTAIAVTAGQKVNTSAFAKLSTRSRVRVEVYDTGTPANLLYASFNLNTGTIIAQGVGGTGATIDSATIELDDEGFYRIGISGDIAAATSLTARFYLLDNSGTLSYAGDAVSGLFLWGMQFEPQGNISDYQATTNTTIARVLDGGLNLEGKPIPISVGWMYRNKAFLLGDRIYQFHDGTNFGAVDRVDGVEDKGSALILDTAIGSSGDVATFALLVAAAPASGKYCTCKALGLLKVGLEPDGDLSVSGRGSVLSGTWSGKAGVIMAYLADAAFGITDLDTTALNAVDAAKPYELALYTGIIDYNGLSFFEKIVNSFSGWFGMNRVGELDAGITWVAPTAAADITLTETQVDEDSIEIQPVGEVVWSVTLRYRENGTPQNKGELADGLPESLKEIYSKTFQSVTITDEDIKTAYPEAVEVSFDSNIYHRADAVIEAQAILDYWGTPRQRVTLQSSLRPLVADLGQIVTLTNPRFNLSSGQKFTILVFDEFYLSSRTGLAIIG